MERPISPALCNRQDGIPGSLDGSPGRQQFQMHVGAGELPEVLQCCPVVGSCCVPGVIKRAEALVLAICTDVGPVTAALRADALLAGRIVPVQSLVMLVLGIRGRAQIRPPVVEPIMVIVVDLRPAGEKTVKELGSPLPAGIHSPQRVPGSAWPRLHRKPRACFTDRRVIGSVYPRQPSPGSAGCCGRAVWRTLYSPL